ncbi:tRNA pseudouridine(55) synthase TruB [Sphingomonas carotinifaciens]|uniref:tRNA pseudouridine synthase B n=1 Tax=Sphingomonas carotinifaciens TaxID=1166323 RepID=A0A1G7GDU5_9SPHN|nr:tRNA pseudouridine(55) synthase TruB [Sphingomonas carotinifaciens]MBB4086474.1 tRNA pseudouridine55 synthase [Sphingomonas carotinifaciens]MWC42826.1 tRNA pseudouridine(55) synthase TruB [Sphingomonas carotinifaciens]SDE86253.1 tRNA pseudouridine synthase B [Sphingomonas carotinifaciens]
MHGWIILDKPLEMGSTQGVSAVKRVLRQGGYGKWKVGHGGTLDPLATGVLPIAIGEATKLAGRLLDSDKVYDFTIRFGTQTATLDTEGAVVATSDTRPTRAALDAVLPRFTGAIEQVPPAYSALKVDGQRAYDLARAGEEVVLATRNVTVHRLHAPKTNAGPHHPFAQHERIEAQDKGPETPPGQPDEALEEITLTAYVSKGTYIRSLARDIALALGTVGHVTMLRRTKAGPFTLQNAITLDKLNELGQARTLEQILLPLSAGLDDIPALALSPDQAGALRQGRVLAGIAMQDGMTLATLDQVPVALVEIANGEVRVLRGFNLD